MSLLARIAPLAAKFVSKDDLRHLAVWALNSLADELDTEGKQRREEYLKDRAQFEADTRRDLAEIEVVRKRQTEVALQRQTEEQRLARNEASLKQLQEEVRRIDEQPSKVDSLSSNAVMRDDLRRHGGGAGTGKQPAASSQQSKT